MEGAVIVEWYEGEGSGLESGVSESSRLREGI